MLKPGKVEHLEDDRAWVKMQKGTSCGDGHCALSSTLLNDSGTDFYIVKAKNEISAPVGADVLVEVKDSMALKISFMIYLFPIILALGAYLTIKALTSNRILVGAVTLGAILISLFILKRADQTLRPDYSITGFIEGESCSQCPFIRKNEKDEKMNSER